MSTRADPTVIGVFVLGALTMLVHFAATTRARRVLSERSGATAERCCPREMSGARRLKK
jgi:hypothetical protein